MLALKVAVAIAIIRSKPENESCLTYTKNLQRTFIFKQSQLENDLKYAKLKIFHLEEQLGGSNLQKIHPDITAGGGNDLPELTPPPSDEIKACMREEHHYHEQNMALMDVEHIKFIQNVITLKNLSAYPTDLSREDMSQLTADQIESLSNILSRGLVALSEKCLGRAGEAVNVLLASHSWLEDCDRVMQGVCKLIEMILSKIKEPSSCDQNFHHQKQCLMQMLLTLMASSPKPSHLPMIILDSLMESWEEFCQGLRNARKTDIPLDPQACESSFFIIRSMELATKSWLMGGYKNSLHPASLCCIQERLENSLLHLTDNFFLVAQAVWRVTGIIEKMLLDLHN